MDVIFCLPCFLRTAICLLDVKIQYINVYVFFFFFSIHIQSLYVFISAVGFEVRQFMHWDPVSSEVN